MATASDNLSFGDKFHVTADLEVRDKDGNFITRFCPGYTYAVTKRNYPDIIGKVIKGPHDGDTEASVSTGKATTGRAR